MVCRSLVHKRIHNPVNELEINITRSLFELKKSHIILSERVNQYFISIFVFVVSITAILDFFYSTGTRYVFDYESDCLWIEVSVERIFPPRTCGSYSSRLCTALGGVHVYHAAAKAAHICFTIIQQNIMIYENILQKITLMNQLYD